jgi:hypothetical protein
MVDFTLLAVCRLCAEKCAPWAIIAILRIFSTSASSLAETEKVRVFREIFLQIFLRTTLLQEAINIQQNNRARKFQEARGDGGEQKESKPS